MNIRRRAANCAASRWQKKPDTLTHLSAEKWLPKAIRAAFRAVLDSTIALAVWLQIELAEPWQPWLADIRSRLGNIMRADALGNRWASKRLSGFLTKIRIGFHQPLRYLDHDHLVPEASHGRDAALLNLLRTKVRETETVAAQSPAALSPAALKYYARTFCRR